MFTSPHIHSYRERIRVNNELITESDIEKYLTHIFNVIESEKIDITWFEITNMLAFLKFKDEKVDFGVFEAGIGGRLDSTNVLNPSICAITSVGYDH